ncbi:MAG: cellulase family glycosylhydrolase [Bacteroidota bacterium]
MKTSTRYLLAICLAFSLPFMILGQQTPFSRGVNITNWFQAGNAYQIRFSAYGKSDFEDIKSLGCDVIRLPINLHNMTQGAPDYTLEPVFFTFLDSAVSWAEEVGIHLILDNHTFDPAVNTDPAVEDVLTKTWVQMATHYKDRSNLIYYEVLNEPHGISDAIWGAIQGRVIDAIRTVDTTHTIIVGPASWNSYNNLQYLPNYTDEKLIYTFHFYDPFLFTHQGASWTDPSFEPLANLPFPYDANSMPPMPSVYNGTWIANLYNNYSSDGTGAKMKELLDIAVNFRNTRNVPVFCGEFGVFIPNSNQDDRIRWYDTLHTHLDAAGISWTMWDYRGGFGLFKDEFSSFFDHDLNIPLLNALNFNVPPQSPLVIEADTAGFFIYRDFIEQGLWDVSGPGGRLSFYDQNNPNYGAYHIQWENANQYSTVGFDYRPDKDLTSLEVNDYAVDFFARPEGGALNYRMDVRFLDTKTSDPSDHPWRMVSTVDVGNGGWKHFHLPLKDFNDVGSWDNGQWYTSQGLFDWMAVDRFEFVAEPSAFNGKISIDHVQITNLDTAMVKAPSSIVIGSENPLAIAYPNPFQHTIQLRFINQELWKLELLDLRGALLKETEARGEIAWELNDVQSGFYVLRISHSSGHHEMIKIQKL